jgi:serine/threonine protein kinase
MDAGSVVDKRYEVRRALSVTGGMGDVYLCWDRKLGREVAVKLIKPEHSSESEYRERFQREVNAAIALEGHDVVRIYEYGECAERHAPYCAMEYLRGRDLRSELGARGPLELSRALEILLDVCKVMGAAHARGIVHRDLKPSNLFLEGPPSPRRSVRVLDFGVARVLGDPRDGAITQLGGQPGSPNYMSPEQHKNELQVGIAADIWALGAILYEMVAGVKAWPGESYEARQRVLEDATPSVRAVCPELPDELERVIRKCLEKDPRARYTSIRDLEEALRDLQSVFRQPDKTLPTVESSPSQTARVSPYRLGWVLAWIALGLLGLGVLVFVAAMPRQQPAVVPRLAAAEPEHAPDPPAQGADRVASPRAANHELASEPSGRSNAVPETPAQESSKTSIVTEGNVPATDRPTPSAGTARRASAAQPASSPRERPSTSAPKLPRNETRLKTK